VSRTVRTHLISERVVHRNAQDSAVVAGTHEHLRARGAQPARHRGAGTQRRSPLSALTQIADGPR
jgi:hypothetical protein